MLTLDHSPVSDIDVVLFGALGSGKSSIINLLSEREVAPTSSGAEPCTERPRSYQISLDGFQVRLWDTMGFFLAYEGPTNSLLPFEHAHAVLRNIPKGVNLILLCADKGKITPSLRSLYWLINEFFYGGRAPIAFIVTHFDPPEEEWWDRNKSDIANRTSIPVEVIPHACVTTVRTNCEQSKHDLKKLLQTYVTAVAPIPLRRNFSSFTASDLSAHCRVSNSEAIALLETFRKPLRPFDVVFFGTGISSAIHLISRHSESVTESSPGTYARSYRINTGLQQFRIWDILGALPDVDHDAHMGYLENARQLIHHLSGEGGIDLLVFCKRHGKPDPKELNHFRLFQKVLFQWQFPVAIILTDVESPYFEQSWRETSKDLVRFTGRDVIGHSCIPSLTSYSLDDIEFDEALLKSRFSVETMLEDCVSQASQSTWFSFSWAGVKAIAWKYILYWQNASVNVLMGRYGLPKEQADSVRDWLHNI